MAAVNPDVVRELATEHILEDARRAHDVGAAVIGHFGPDALTKHQYGDYCTAIREAIATATVTVKWPDTVTTALPERREPAEFGIVALHACDIQSTWIQVHHVPCAEVVFGGTDDPEDTDAGELLARMAVHRCDAVAEPRDVSQMVDINVAGDGGTVTAVVHSSRRLDDEEQAAMVELLRATRRMEREKRQEAARQRDEDVRAVDRLLRELRARTGVDALKAVTRLEERYADRIAELHRRDAEGPVTSG